MDLILNKPLAFFDLETTGINVTSDRIVEISVLKVFPDNSSESLTERVNPEMPIPLKTSKIHGIYDEDVKDKPTFKEIAPRVALFIEGCDLAGYNSNVFDIPLLAEEFIRANVDIDLKKRKLIDVQVIFHKMEQRTLSAAYQFYCGKSLENAHSAEADAIATFEVLKSQLDRYPDLKNDMEYLSKFATHNKAADFAGRIIFNSEGEEIFNFGKYKGEKVEDIFDKYPNYYNWMMDGDFPLYTKNILTRIKLRKFNTKG